MMAYEIGASLEVNIDELGDTDGVGPDDPIQQKDKDPEDLKRHDDRLVIIPEEVLKFHFHAGGPHLPYPYLIPRQLYMPGK
jgi:hypothetical protein